ncbi:MAG: ABC transporter permease [Thermodesulfobacteria bacterium]|nr:ABC transporter permease [Thermodesulfobacteriota bacterium]
MAAGLKAVLKRELLSYFNAPIAYVFAVVFLLVANGLFMTTFFLTGLCDMRGFFQTLPLILIIFIPALTMRLWAEERKSGTISLLYTIPASTSALVLGKFLAAFLFALLTLASTFVIPVMLSVLGDPDWGPILGGYLGAALLAAFLISLGQAISAFFEDQIVAFIITLVIGFSAYLFGTDLVSTSIDSWLPGVGNFLRQAFGIPPHFSSLAKGVVSLRDVLFFVSYIVVFLLWNGFTISGYLRYFQRKAFYFGSALLILGLFFLNAALSQIRLPRLDLTEDKIYTVSPAAKKILERLEVPIQVTYYVSPKEELPAPMKTIARDVADILAEFAALSPKFSYRIVDPTRDPELIPKLREKGIVPFAVQTIERDEVSVKRIYSALSISYLDKKEEIIPEVMPNNLGTLEYDIISRIYKLTLKEKPVVALHTPAPVGSPFMMGPQDPYRTLREVLEYNGLEVRNAPLTKENTIPGEAKLLFIVEPKELNDRQLYEIEHFLRTGHPVIIAAQGFKYSYNPGPEGEIVAYPIKEPLAVNRWLRKLGFEIDERHLFDEQSVVLALSIPRRIGMFTAIVRQPVRFPMQIEILPPQMNQKLSVTSRLSGLLYLWGSALKVSPKENLKIEELFHSSPRSWLHPYNPGPLVAGRIKPEKDDPRGPFPLAIMVSGRFPQTFDEVPPWPGEEDSENMKGRKSPGQGRESRLVLIGSSEMFADTAIQAFSNAIFAANLVESLTLGEELLYIRAKTQVQRYLPELSDRQKFFWRFVVIFLPPALWVSFGLLHAIRRRRRREQYLRRRAS